MSGTDKDSMIDGEYCELVKSGNEVPASSYVASDKDNNSDN